MANSRVANPIAVRQLSVVGEPDREVRIIVGKPRPEPDPSVWRCSYLVEGLPKARRRVAHGADALQALQQAMSGAKAAIQASGLACTWESGEPGDIGIPSTVPSFPWSGFSQRIERYIEREVEKFARKARATPGGQARAKNKAATM
jgi:hypothetical protein